MIPAAEAAIPFRAPWKGPPGEFLRGRGKSPVLGGKVEILVRQSASQGEGIRFQENP